MRYLRKETVYILENSKIIIPECIRRISNFNKGTGQEVFICVKDSSIIISANSLNINAAIGELNELEFSANIIKNANMTFTSIVALYLLDIDTIEVMTTQAIINDKKQTFTHSKILDEYFIVENTKEFIKIHFSDIYYFEKVKGTHNTCIVFVGGMSTFKQGLKEILNKLDIGFMQCHRAFIANMTRLTKIEKLKTSYVIHFDNNTYCPCSMFYYRGVLDWKP